MNTSLFAVDDRVRVVKYDAVGTVLYVSPFSDHIEVKLDAPIVLEGNRALRYRQTTTYYAVARELELME